MAPPDGADKNPTSQAAQDDDHSELLVTSADSASSHPSNIHICPVTVSTSALISNEPPATTSSQFHLVVPSLGQSNSFTLSSSTSPASSRDSDFQSVSLPPSNSSAGSSQISVNGTPTVRPGSAPLSRSSSSKPPPPPRGSSLRNDVSKDRRPSEFVLKNLASTKDEDESADVGEIQQNSEQPQLQQQDVSGPAENSTDDELQVGFYTDLKRRITLGRNWKLTHKQAVRRRKSTSAYLHAVDTLNSFSQTKSSSKSDLNGQTASAEPISPPAVADGQPGYISPEIRQKYIQVRQYIVGEILQTEQNYVAGMDVVLQRFRAPLIKAATGGVLSSKSSPLSTVPSYSGGSGGSISTTLTDSKLAIASLQHDASGKSSTTVIIPLVDIKIIFAYIEDLHDFNKMFLRELELVVKNWEISERLWAAKETGYTAVEGEAVKSIGNLFTNYESGWRVYLKYVDNYSAAKEAIRRSEENSHAYRQFIQECLKSKDCQRQGISDFLILPIQRVTRYVLLLQDLKKHTPPDHPEYSNILRALEFMRTLAGTVNDVKRREEEMTRMFHVVRTVEDCPPTLISAHRRILCEADTLDVTRDFYHLAFVPLAVANAGISILPSAVTSPAAIQMDNGTYFRLFIFTDVLMMTKLKNRKKKDKRLASIAGGDSVSLAAAAAKKEKMTLFRMAWLKDIEVLDVKNSDISVYYKTNSPRLLIKLVIHNSDAGDPVAKRRFWAQLADAKADGLTKKKTVKELPAQPVSVNKNNNNSSNGLLSTTSDQQQAIISSTGTEDRMTGSMERLTAERISTLDGGDNSLSAANGMTRGLQAQGRRMTTGSSSANVLFSLDAPPSTVDPQKSTTQQNCHLASRSNSGGNNSTAPQPRTSSLIANDPSITSLYEQMKFDTVPSSSSDVGVLVTAPSVLPAKPPPNSLQPPASILQSPDLSPMMTPNSAPGIESPLAAATAMVSPDILSVPQSMRSLSLTPAAAAAPTAATTTITETFILEFDDAKQKGEFLLIVGKLII